MKKRTNKDNIPHYLSLQNYVVGFVGSLVLTLCVYFVVAHHVDSGHTSLSHQAIIIFILIMAAIQLVVQAVFFLHLGRERETRWNLVAFLFMIMVVGIVVVGSLWIMDNLNYNMMTPHETEQYIEHEEAIPAEKHHH